MSLLAGPMVLLYEFCIWMAWYMEWKEAKKEKLQQEKDREAIIEKQKNRDDEERPDNDSSSDTGALEYNPDNEVIYEDQSSDVIEENDESATFDEYHTGLNDEAEPVDPTSDSVWGYSDQAKGGSVPEESDTYTDDHHYPLFDYGVFSARDFLRYPRFGEHVVHRDSEFGFARS